MTHFTLPWGEESLDLDVPDHWNIAGCLEPAFRPGVEDVPSEVKRSLHNPVGLPGLGELFQSLSQGERTVKVVLVIDDSSRPTPVAKILPIVIQDLANAGLKPDNVTIIPALGLHLPMQVDEITQRTGLENMSNWKWENPACDDPAHLVFLGTTSRGTPVWVNKTVAEADLVISIGCIEPHLIASFGGGYKNLIPGVAGLATTAHNHSLNCTNDTFNMTGQPIDRNPMRLDLEEGARMLKPPVFIVNAVLNSSNKIVRIVAGDPILAHREGCKISASMYGVGLDQPADIVITSSHPMNRNFRQGVKALGNTIRAVRRGGIMITLVKADEGLGVFGMANQKLPLGRKGIKALAPFLVRLVPRIKLKGMGEEDRFFLYSTLQVIRRADLLMVAPTIPEETRSHLPFARFVDTPREALDSARQRFPSRADVLIFPYGGTTYPSLP
jgi:nickel-dependent lactate racemase